VAGVSDVQLAGDEAPLPQPTGDSTPDRSQFRRAALLATAVTVPVVVVLVVIIQLALGSVALMSPLPTLAQRPLSVIDVDTPAVSPEVEAACTSLITTLPLNLDNRDSRPVRSSRPTAYAWGEDPIILRCGVPRPAAYLIGVSTVAISEVEWFFETAAAGTTYTAVDRGVYLEIFVPSSADGGAVLAILAPLIVAALPYVTPIPG